MRVNPAPLDNFPDDERGEVVRPHVLERAAVPPDRRPHRLHNHGFTHEAPPGKQLNRRDTEGRMKISFVATPLYDTRPITHDMNASLVA